MLWKTSAVKSSPMPVYLDGSACLIGALLLLTLPFPWLISAIAAAVIHELFHIGALYLLKAPPVAIRIGFRGTVIRTPPMDPKETLLCAAAGPFGSLLLLFLIHVFPRLAICAAVQGLYNLLPVYPLDGGRILRAGIEFFKLRKRPCKESKLAVQ